MKKIDQLLFVVTPKELKTLNASAFEDHSCIYIQNEKTGEYIYNINLEKGEYKSFGLRSTVQNTNTYKLLGCTAGTPGGWPYYIADFIHR
jgi:hypothetical protein